MTTRPPLSLPSSACAVAPAGTWKLPGGRAATLRPHADGILRVASGRIWATVDGPHGRTPQDAGDHILQPGRAMYVRAGQRVVIEAWDAACAAHFAWDAVDAAAVAAPARLAVADVLQPLAELRGALALAGHALGRLAVGAVRLAWSGLHGRRALPARRAHGAPV